MLRANGSRSLSLRNMYMIIWKIREKWNFAGEPERTHCRSFFSARLHTVGRIIWFRKLFYVTRANIARYSIRTMRQLCSRKRNCRSLPRHRRERANYVTTAAAVVVAYFSREIYIHTQTYRLTTRLSKKRGNNIEIKQAKSRALDK